MIFKQKLYNIFLNIFYWIFICPFGFWSRKVSDPFKLLNNEKYSTTANFWFKRSTRDHNLNDARNQY